MAKTATLKDPIVGAKIVEVRKMTKKETAMEGWYRPGMVLVLSTGAVLYTSQDEEGNGPGSFFYTFNGKCFGLE